MTPSELWQALTRLHADGQLGPALRDSYTQAVDLLRDDYLPVYATVAAVAVTVELVVVAGLLWWAVRSDRLTDTWAGRLRVAFPVAVAFGLVRFALAPAWWTAGWVLLVAAGWWVFTRRPRPVGVAR